MTRLLVLCAPTSALSPVAAGWLRHHANAAGLKLEVWSAGTEKTFGQPAAFRVMRGVGTDLRSHGSKTRCDVPEPFRFDLVLTLCTSARAACPARTRRLHVFMPDPSGQSLQR